MDWGEEDIDHAHDVFEKCDNRPEAGEQVDWREFERELKNVNINYQAVKSIVLAFWRNHQWTNICYGYAMSFEPTIPIEFH